jgi:outer membrane protein assembly factor BamB
MIMLAVLALCAGCDWAMPGYGPGHAGYNPTETQISVDNVSSLVPRFTAATTNFGQCGASPFCAVSASAAISAGVAYVGSEDQHLYAFDAAGKANCAGSPTTCDPLWSAEFSTTTVGSPAVVHGVVYVNVGPQLTAFDAAGVTNCSGSPRVCAPLWTASTGNTISPPTVVDGVVYVNSGDGNLYAFDAAGSSNCAGSPRTCAPLWTGAVATNGNVVAPVVERGVVYVGAGGPEPGVLAFDAAGAGNCSGTPTTCAPLWTGTTSEGVLSTAVVDGVVYAGSATGKLYAFDAAGTTNCAGQPVSCAPMWTTAETRNSIGGLAVANGVVYTSGHMLVAFDAAGQQNCTGNPRVCAPLWTAATGFNPSGPAVANGVVYYGSQDGSIYALDATGTEGCGGVPKVCAPLWHSPTPAPIISSPVVANGIVYIGSDDQHLHAYGLP